jgi:hypothetical protein
MDEIRLGDAAWIHDGPPIDGEFTELEALAQNLCAVCWWLHVESVEQAAERIAIMIVGGHSVCRDHIAVAASGGTLLDVLRRIAPPRPRPADLPAGDHGCDYA